MNRHARTGLAVLLVLLAIGPAAQAQRPRRGGNFGGQLRWVQFRIAGGRITATSPHFGRSMTSQSSGEGRHETLSISLADGVPVVHYELSSARELTSIHIANGSEVEVHREPRGESTDPPLAFTQLPGRQLTLTIGRGDDERQVHGPTLWHILLTEPEVGGEQLGPLLQLLNPDWKLAGTLAALEGALVAGPPPRKANQALWATLVQQLASDLYAQRQQADRKLRAAGPGLLPYLQLLDRGVLDAEQQWRIKRIVSSLEAENSDETPEGLASWLSWDPRTWLPLLERDDESIRRAAAERLAVLLDAPLEFDPAADVSLRRAQVAALRERFDPAPTDLPRSNADRPAANNPDDDSDDPE